MRIDIISVLPELIQSPFNASILKRAAAISREAESKKKND